jgi:multidrug transporter EmrE-like cation transporter
MIYKILLLIGIIFNVLAQIALKNAMNGMDLLTKNTSLLYKSKNMLLNPLFLCAVTLYGLGFILYAVVLSKVELSKAYPIASVGAIILVSISSILFLNESITIYKTIGIGFCIAGIFLIL